MLITIIQVASHFPDRPSSRKKEIGYRPYFLFVFLGIARRSRPATSYQQIVMIQFAPAACEIVFSLAAIFTLSSIARSEPDGSDISPIFVDFAANLSNLFSALSRLLASIPRIASTRAEIDSLAAKYSKVIP